MIPPFIAQLSRELGVTISLPEGQDWENRKKKEVEFEVTGVPKKVQVFQTVYFQALKEIELLEKLERILDKETDKEFKKIKVKDNKSKSGDGETERSKKTNKGKDEGKDEDIALVW